MLDMYPVVQLKEWQQGIKVLLSWWLRFSELPSYGYRRVWGLLGRARETQLRPAINVKRVYRVMRSIRTVP